MLEKDKGKISEEEKKKLEFIATQAGTMTKDQMGSTIKDLNIKNPDTGNDLTEPEEFNLMFKTSIGPSGLLTGYLRPETAQGIFVNFNKLLDFNGGKMPFAGAQIGLGFRNEIAPRSGLLRVREFEMAEIEHFVDPEDKKHPKYKNIKHYKLPLFSKEKQGKMEDPHFDLTLEDALAQKIIDNETLAYFICRTYIFLVSAGVNPQNIRFRQHCENEMAHYASDCWDAEIETSYGWVECVGIADRSCYDLNCHAKVSKIKHVAARKFSQPQTIQVVKVNMNKGVLGGQYKGDSKLLFEYIAGCTTQELLCLKNDFDTKGTLDVELEGKKFVLDGKNCSFELKNQQVMEEKYTPNVIEPSFGIGRILYSIFEHSFKMRDEKRTFLHLPAKIAPVKCSILPLVSSLDFDPLVNQISISLKKRGISNKVDSGSSTIGRRYARTDEIGIPFGITVDNQSLTDSTVTLREISTTKQVRIPVAEVVEVMENLIEGFLDWNAVLTKYPLFESKTEESEE